jgi:hypothetical protein
MMMMNDDDDDDDDARAKMLCHLVIFSHFNSPN